MAGNLMDRTAEIVVAYLAQHRVEPDRLAKLVDEVADALRRTMPATEVPEWEKGRPDLEPLDPAQGSGVTMITSGLHASAPEVPPPSLAPKARKPRTAKSPAPASVQQEPAVAIEKSVTPDYIVCLEDGVRLKMLKRHLRTKFQLSPEEYKAKWGLPSDYPIVAPAYAAERARIAAKKPPPPRQKKNKQAPAE